ncbi:MAG: acyl carrier protein [Lachnospiraceae bacterium]|nr:acyl carrier protein [Lachnospiraceae bacterium]
MELEVLKKAIEKILQVYSTEITPEATFDTVLGADSIDLAQIFRLVEDELAIRVPAEEWAKVRTVGEAYDLILKVKNNEG